MGEPEDGVTNTEEKEIPISTNKKIPSSDEKAEIAVQENCSDVKSEQEIQQSEESPEGNLITD